jgi:nucleotide-binding universal stress UspA family protein
MAAGSGRRDPEEGDQGGFMRGTLVCAVTAEDESADALALGAELSGRLDLRLVIAHPVERVDSLDGAAAQARRRDAERRLTKLAQELGVGDRAERRVAIGEQAALLGQIAAEEAADVIVVGARTRGWRKRLESRLADELETETPVPVLIAPPRPRRSADRRL